MDFIFNSDIKRWGNLNRLNQFKKILFVPQIRFIFFKRICEFYRSKSKILFYFFRIIYEHYKIKYNIDLPCRTILGKGFVIEHIGGIVINPEVIFGDNINLYNGVTIGVTKRGKRQGVPVIGNQVWIGANSIIVGKITIGNNVLIAPGAYVNFDIPSDSIVIGNPGKIIPSEKATMGYIKNIV